MPDKWAQYATQPSQGDKWAQYAQSAQPDALPPPPAAPLTTGQKLAKFGVDAAKGLGESAVGLMSSGNHAVRKIPGIGEWLTTPINGTPADQAIAHTDELAKPVNSTQSFAKGVGDAAQFLIPGGAEEKAVSMVPKAFKTAAKIGASALGAGAVNKAQGGSFGAGAAMGGAGTAGVEGLKAAAPGFAEAALNIRKLDRAYGKMPGRAILDETKGFRPGTVADSAQGTLDKLNLQLKAAADNSTNQAFMAPARNQLGEAFTKAERQGERSTISQLTPMDTHLADTISGQSIPNAVTPRELLDLKRGFGNEFIHRWNPDTMEGVKGTAGRVYHAMGEEFNRAVPEAGDLNRRISGLIPVAKRAESTELNAPTTQRVLGRFAAHTGALAGGAVGFTGGYQHGGLPEALEYGAMGVVAPELIASPTGQMMIARALNSPANAKIAKALTGGALVATHKEK